MSSVETLPAPITALTPSPGLFERVEAIGGRSARPAWIAACIFAITVHAGGGGLAAVRLHDIYEFMGLVRHDVTQRLAASIELDELQEEPPAPEPEPEEKEPEPAPETEPEPEVPLPVDETIPPSEEPPPPAAEAGQILAAEPDPSEPLDLTEEGFVTGPGTNFSGGKTASTGTSKTAVRDARARPSGINGAKGKAEAVGGSPAVDKSRPAGLPTNANWNSCPWPAQATSEQINNAVVRVVVVVAADGRPTSVNVVSEPGYGFGNMAQRCAMRFTYPVGLDKMGNPTARATPPFRIKFQR